MRSHQTLVHVTDPTEVKLDQNLGEIKDMEYKLSFANGNDQLILFLSTGVFEALVSQVSALVLAKVVEEERT